VGIVKCGGESGVRAAFPPRYFSDAPLRLADQGSAGDKRTAERPLCLEESSVRTVM
jgi:hypothetical protein